MNGDGLPDLVQSHESGPNRHVHTNDSEKADLLHKVTSSSGATTTIIYKGSPEFLDGSQIRNPHLPFQLNVVEAIGVSDGFGTTATTTYTYGGGEYYFNGSTDRQFAGFATTTRTDPLGFVTKTFYHQQGSTTQSTIGEYQDHIAKKGKPYRIEVYDASNNLYQKTINTWDRTALDYKRNYVYLARTTDMIYDGDADHKDKAETYRYNTSTGNLTYKQEWGEVTGSDDGTFTASSTDRFGTTITYASSTTVPFIGFPAQATVVNNASTTVKDTKFYYDSLANGSVTKGNETKREFWKSGSSYASTTKTYNTYGLPIQETDPRSKTTTYTYDSNNLFIATSTNPVNLSTGFVYDYSSGKVKRTNNPHNYIFETTFDGLDRSTEEKQPDVTTPSTLVINKTVTYTDTIGSRKVQETHYLNSATSTDTYTYFDGLDRTIQERVEAETNPNYSVKDFQYDKRGKLHRESLPYFSTGSSRTTASTDQTLFATTVYDTLDRPTAIGTAVGTTSYVYDQWKTTITDPESNIKRLASDGYGNLFRVEEVNDSSTYITLYEYSYLKNLTKITDDQSNIRNFTYDGVGRRTAAGDLHALTDTTYGTTTYTYDDAGNVTSKTDPKSQTINFTYDDINRPLTEDYTGGSGTEITYSYDTCDNGKGMLCGATTTAAGLNYTYDPMGRIKTERHATTSIFTTTYTHDRQGNITDITYPDNAVVNYIYNTAGLLETVSKRENGTTTPVMIVQDTDYGPTGAVTYRNLGNGTETTNTYDATKLYRLTNILTTATTTTETFGVGGEGLLEEADLLAAQERIMRRLLNASTSPHIDEFGETPTTTVAIPDIPLVPDQSIATATPSVIEPMPLENLEVSMSTLAAENTAPSTDTSASVEPPIDSLPSPSATPIVGELIDRQAAKAERPLVFENTSVITSNADVRVIVGHKNATDPSPNATLTRWDEVSLDISVTAANATSSSLVRGIDGKIIWNGSDKHVRFYELPETAELPEGGYEIDVVYDAKPSSNVVSMHIDSRNLGFFYQPTLDKEKHGPNIASCNATTCLDTEGRVWIERPERIVGSYAVYYKDHTSGDFTDIGGKNYRAGKAFHIYRPQITDSAGASVWGDINIDPVAGTLTITIPQDFLETAAYPIIVDPTFGYATVGGTSSGWGTGNIGTDGKFYGPTANGTANSLFLYGRSSDASANVQTALYDTSNRLVANSNSVAISNSNAWWEFPLSNQAVTATTTSLNESFTGTTFPPTATCNSPGWTTGGNANWSRHTSIYHSSPASAVAPSSITDNQSSWIDCNITLTATGTLAFQWKVSSEANFDYLLFCYNNDSCTRTTGYDQRISGTVGFTRVTKSMAPGTHSLRWLYAKDSSVSSGSDVGWIDTVTVDEGGYNIAFNPAETITRFYDTGAGTPVHKEDVQTYGTWPNPITWDIKTGQERWSLYGTYTSTAGGSAVTSILQNISYTYDNVGNITQITDHSATGAGKIVAYTYDGLNRLLTASTTQATSTPYSRTYTYSSLGNLLTSSTQSPYTYAGTNYANPHAPTSINGVTLSYDNNGNLTTYGTSTYSWDYRNRIKQAGTGTATSSYGYDYQGNRVSMTSGGITTKYANRLYSTNGATTTKHIFVGDTLIATVERVGTATTTHIIHTDHLGGTNVVTDANGDVVQTLDYYPYGSLRINNKTSTMDEVRKFTGHEYDSGVGLNYMRARYQDPTRGQFLSQDPAHLLLGDPRFEKKYGRDLSLHLSNPQGLNSYSYAVNNPLRITDSDGEILPLLVAVALAVGAGIFLDDIPVAQAPTTGSIQSYESKSALEHYSPTYDRLSGFQKLGLGLLIGGLQDDAKRVLKVSKKRLEHIIERHTISGSRFNPANKSSFDSTVDIPSLIQEAADHPAVIKDGFEIRTFDAGRDIGVDRETGNGTSIVTIITDKDGNVLTAHPGMPGEAYR